jgi:hypothetical protein
MKVRLLKSLFVSSGTILLALTAVLPARADYSSTVQSFNPIMYYHLNETAPVPIADQAVNLGTLGAAVNGFYSGAVNVNYFHPTAGALAGSSDGAATFSGLAGTLIVPYAASLNPTVFTAEVWLSPADLDGTIAGPTHCAFSCGDFAAPRAGWLVYQSGEGWNLRMYNQNGLNVSLSISGGGPPVAGSWYHVVVAFNGTTATLYINGVSVASGNPLSYVPGTAGNLTVGGRADSSFFWNGNADELAFYPTALSAAQILTHYQNGTNPALSANYPTQVLADGAIGYWRLDEPTWVQPDPSTLPVATNSGSYASGADGAYGAGSITGVAGVPFSGFPAGNKAASFNARAGSISIPGQALVTDTLTITGWLKRERNQSLGTLFFQRDGSMNFSTGLQIWDSGGNNELRANWDGNEWGTSTGLTPPDGVWTFVAMVVTPTDTVIYMDDRSVSLAALSGGSLAHSAHDFSVGSILIGQDPCCGVRIFKGEIDEVAVFDTALTPAQINQLLNSAGNIPPVILTQPQAATNYLAGSPLALATVAFGSPTLAYQWLKDGSPMSGKTDAALTFSNITTNDPGSYSVIITNAFGAVTSSIVSFTVTSVPAVLSRAVGYPVYNSVVHTATLTEVLLEFSAPLGAGGADPAKYSISDGVNTLSVTAGRFTNENKTVLLTTAPQTQGTTYTVTGTGVPDGSGQPIVSPNNTAQFRAWVASPANGVVFEYYPGSGDTTVPGLTNNLYYPDSPSWATNLWAFDSRIVFPDDTHNTYGARMRTYFTPDTSGNWRFFLRSDDSSQVFLNPNGTDPAGKILILDGTTCCLDWNGYQSPAFPLVAGQPYYLEMLYKEGGGGDYGKVAARMDGTGYPVLGIANIVIDPAALAGPAIGYPYAPADIGGTLSVVGPTDVTVQANHLASFSVSATGPAGQEILYQWRRNGVNIPGATSDSYALYATTADNNIPFSVQVSKAGSVLTPAATLHVTADTDLPTVVAVRGSTLLNTVTVSFSELMQTTQDPSWYTIGGVSPISATVDSTGMNVILTFNPPLAAGQTYNLVIQGAPDLAGHVVANVTAPLRTFVFSRGLLRYDYFGHLSPMDVAVTDLTSDPRYPDSPDWTAFIPAFNSRTIFPDDSHEAYGSHVTGLFVPPTNGNYVFYLRSDDNSQLYLNPLGSDPFGRQFLVEELTCCHSFSALASAAQTLVAGQWYFIETLQKEGGGGDYVQVATKLDSDPANPDSLFPIAGSLLGVLADPVGASVTITQQPVNVLAVYQGADAPQAVFNENFNATNGGLTMTIYGTPIPDKAFSPWAWDSVRGTWSCSGSNDCFGAIGNGLTLPAITMAKSGGVVLTFAHRYSFEGFNASDGTAWDGGQVRLSVNGGPFASVPAANFSTNGYLGQIGGTVNTNFTMTPGWINAAFIGESPDYASETYLTSVASLGFFNAGDTLRIQFATSWDECSEGTEPNWEIDSVQVTVGAAVPVAVSLTVGAESTYLSLPNPYQAYIWQQDTGSGFTDIAGANSPTCLLNFWPADSGERFRCIVYGPGASATSAVATVTVTLPLAVARTAPNSLRLSWPLPPPPLTATSFLLEKSATLLPGSWATVPIGTYQTTSTQVFVPVTIAPADPPTFYRLRRN